LALVYLFRYQISGNFPKVAVVAGLAILVMTAAPLFLFGAANTSIPSFLKSHTEPATLYLSLVLGVPLGVLILSYRSQDEFLRSPLPDTLAKAVNESLRMSEFVHERVDYIIELVSSGDSHIVLRFDVTMNLINRSKRQATYRDIFDPAGSNRRFLYASINGRGVNYEDPERLSERGLHLEYDAKPGENFQVAVKGESTFDLRDSEMVGTYLPCAALSILIRRPPDSLRVSIQSWLSKKVDPRRLESGDLLFEYLDGVLPFQGTRIFWEPRQPVAPSS